MVNMFKKSEYALRVVWISGYIFNEAFHFVIWSIWYDEKQTGAFFLSNGLIHVLARQNNIFCYLVVCYVYVKIGINMYCIVPLFTSLLRFSIIIVLKEHQFVLSFWYAGSKTANQSEVMLEITGVLPVILTAKLLGAARHLSSVL